MRAAGAEEGVSLGPSVCGRGGWAWGCGSAPTASMPRVSVPLSILDPPHRYRIHRRKSLDACDSLALPGVSSSGGPGRGRVWGCPCLAQAPRWSLRPERTRD